MAKINNPFIVSGRIPPAYFCDRVKETSQLTKNIVNEVDTLVISPRRMGKTGLIRHCYEQPVISGEYITFFVDLLHTTGLREFTYLLGRQVYETILPRGKKMVASFVHNIRSLSAQFGFDPVTALPTFSLSLGDITHPELTIEEIFTYLENTGRRCIVALDEFQQIHNYPEKNVEALLRSFTQKTTNVRFIFSGSEQHILQKMFSSSARPFYNSADTLELKAIDIDEYIRFVTSHMSDGGRTITPDVITLVYNAFDGNTYAMQKTFNEVYAISCAGDHCDRLMIETAITNTVNAKEPLLRELLTTVSEKHKPLLYAIATEGKARNVMSAQFVKKHSLASASAVQYSSNFLASHGIIAKDGDSYKVSDPFFALWIARLYGNKTLSQILDSHQS